MVPFLLPVQMGFLASSEKLIFLQVEAGWFGMEDQQREGHLIGYFPLLLVTLLALLFIKPIGASKETCINSAQKVNELFLL